MQSDIIENFLCVYLYELQEALNEPKQRKELKNLKFYKGEANLDSDLKKYIRSFILHKFDGIPTTAKTNETNKTLTVYHDLDDSQESLNYKTFQQIKVVDVHLSKEGKKLLQSKVAPDLLLEIEYKKQTYYKKLELKSTKGNAIPGSSVQQIDPQQWVLFVKHSPKNVEVCAGRYIHAMTNVIRFPDRSPRPEVAFKTLKAWHAENLLTDTTAHIVNATEQEDVIPLTLLDEWQEHMATTWYETITKQTPSLPKSEKNEPWFDPTMRLFAQKYLTYLKDNDISIEAEINNLIS